MQTRETDPYVTEIARLFPVQGRWTEDDFYRLPESNQHIELAQGRLILSPSPLGIHQQAVGSLFIVLTEYTRQHFPDGVTYVAPYDVRLKPGLIRQPDVFFLRGEHLSRDTNRYIDGPPDWAAEVISEGTCEIGEVDKLTEYAQAGIPEYWLIDLDARAIRVYVLRGDDVYQLAGTYAVGQAARSETLPGFESSANS